VQGVSICGLVPENRVGPLRAEVEALGLAVTLYRRWSGGREALGIARALAREVPLPPGLRPVRIDGDTLPELMRAPSDAAASAGVLTLAGNVLRGTGLPGATLARADGAGRVLSCAASTRYAHPDHPARGGEFWWGMLATRHEARRARLSLALGARAMLEAHERFGAERLLTEVQEGNAPSEAVWARIGLAPERTWILTAADPAAVPGGSLTR
jgi:hypothetical protein